MGEWSCAGGSRTPRSSRACSPRACGATSSFRSAGAGCRGSGGPRSPWPRWSGCGSRIWRTVPARSLSGGEQQRVSLARAFALDPEVLLLDEPAAGLDAQTRAAFFTDLDRALESRATTVVQVSHRAQEAFRLADRVVVLVDGLVHQVGLPEVLNRCPADASVAALVGYDNVVDAAVQADGAVCVGASPTGLTSRRGPGAGDRGGVRERHPDRRWRRARPADARDPGDAGCGPLGGGARRSGLAGRARLDQRARARGR